VPVLTFHPTQDLSAIFDKYRNLEASSDSKLSINYSKYFKLNEQLMLSFYQDNNSEPSIFSSIYRKEFWPAGCYRILNRTWQYPRVKRIEKTINLNLYEMITNQLLWCKSQKDFRLAFISRQKNNRLFNKMISDLKEYKNLEFKIGPKLWMCKGNNFDCYQHIMYYGDSNVFEEWWRP
jgi:hypothetical protein